MATAKKTVAKKTVTKKPTVKAVAKPVAKVAAKPVAKPVARPVVKPVAKPAPRPVAKVKQTLSPEERFKKIEETAYLMAEKNGFQGDQHGYWVAAEADVNAKYTVA